jgi:hypothetical protein
MSGDHNQYQKPNKQYPPQELVTWVDSLASDDRVIEKDTGDKAIVFSVLRQRPVAPDYFKLDFDDGSYIDLSDNELIAGFLPYAAPPPREWQGLTDEEIMDLCAAQWASHPIDVARIIEAKLKEKNT